MISAGFSPKAQPISPVRVYLTETEGFSPRSVHAYTDELRVNCNDDAHAKAVYVALCGNSYNTARVHAKVSKLGKIVVVSIRGRDAGIVCASLNGYKRALKIINAVEDAL
jgi:tRNA threonylcarbamoyladenosine modification (KEOPS) complex  Pcc1 subunit